MTAGRRSAVGVAAGTVLAGSKGLTLYMFVPDKDSKVTCVRVCAAVWPPLMLPAGAKAVASDPAKFSLLGSDRDPAGGGLSRADEHNPVRHHQQLRHEMTVPTFTCR